MPMPLLVGVDGSEASLEAVDWAAEEAERHAVPLRLVHVAAADGRGHVTATADGAAADGIVGAAAARAAGRVPSVTVVPEVVHGEDTAAILAEEGRNALAVVLGSRGRGNLAGLLVGSVSLAVAGRADCPVVVVRGGPAHRTDRFRTVVVGIEDGEGSGTAADFAYREADVRHSALVAVHASREPALSAVPQLSLSGYALETGRRPPAAVLDDALRGPGQRYPQVAVERRVVDGAARQALLEAAAAADLLVVGARRRVGHFGLQLGLVNHGVLHHAPCPIAVVPQI
ncbi:universal stress protein [Streptomyces sp. XD-27]|uniref:universal stress protein n=1 Tax=Streptomyces sp. XD-27 TaxID=3062779 RepID=UPI0026F4194C|nr:universal stress protein [Streptomyces sp. XD-27]WKX69009.1 universal stress protein [Streptomyces sp. XD-27]